ncbi:hypothetical protein [Flavobacterium urumqiense]|uniref:hypothetical protein n=1 Tax=Flavobacterium urumqiense TaxID=935224 RepID=UPI0011B085E1|nr:hypothetical protein [Flavobacterium urumqiense]
MFSRCIGDRRKDEVFTEGGLHNHEWVGQEVSRSHSTWGNKLPIEMVQDSQTRKDLTQVVLNFHQNKSYNPRKAEQEEFNVKHQV